MTAFEHDPRGVIIMPHQHLLVHSGGSLSYTNEAIPGVSTIGGALDWVMRVLYPHYQDSVANPAALPTVGNTIGDYRVVVDDGDGKAAGYQWQQREGDSAAKWYKIYDMDWGYDQVLSGLLSKTLDFYVYKHGYDDKDSDGNALTGVNAGQHIFGGASASSNLTLHANAGDGVGAQTGYVQVADNFRPQTDDTWESGSSTEKWKKIWSHDAKIGTLTIDDNTITADGGTVDFVNDIITTNVGIFGGDLRLASGSITNPGSHTPRQVAYLNKANGDYLTTDETDFEFDGTGDFTIAAWLNLRDKAAQYNAVGRWGIGSNKNHYVIFYYQGVDRWSFAISQDGTSAVFVNADNYGATVLDTWVFVVARYRAGTGVYISVNGGTNDFTSHATSTLFNGASGVDFGLGYKLAGADAEMYVANVGVWERELSDAEVTAIYNTGGGLEYQNLTVAQKVDLISYWDLDETSDGSGAINRVDSHGSNDLTDQNTTNSVLWDRYIGGGAIDFSDENLSTTGSFSCGDLTATGTISLASGTTIGTLTLADGSITDSGGSISFGNENLSTTGTLGAGVSTLGNIQVGTDSITQTATDTNLDFVGNGSGVFTFDKQIQISSGGLQVSGNGTFSSGYLQADNIRLDGNTISIQDTDGNLNLDANGSGTIIAGHIFTPSGNGTLDLGASGLRWKDFYISGNISDGSNSISITNLLTFRAVGSPNTNDSLFWDGSKWVASNPDTEIAHDEIGGITTGDAGHTQFVMLAGRDGGQQIYGSSLTGENLTLSSTSHGTKGAVIFTDAVVRSSGNGTTDLGAASYYFKDIYVSGQLKGARLENFTTAGRPSAGSAGRVIFDTDLHDAMYDDGSNWYKMGIDKWEYEDAVTWDGGTATATYTVDGSDTPSRGKITDARKAIWQFKDNTNNHQVTDVKIDHPASNQVRVTSMVNLPAGTYRLIGIG